MEIVEKLRKLIAIRDHPNTSEQEVYNAAQAITRLLYKYNMEEPNVEERLTNPITFEEISYKSNLCGGSWYCNLVSVITNNNLCKCIIVSIPGCSGRLHRDKFQIIGRKNNIELVKYMIDSFTNRFYSIGKKIYKSTYVGELTENKFLRSFLKGCAIGLNAKYCELQNINDYKSLIVSVKSDIDDFLKGRNLVKSRKSKERTDVDAYLSGYNVGKNSEINKGLSNNKLLLNGRKS